MTYRAIVCKLANVRKHPNADRLLISNCLGNQIICGLDSKDGDVGVYFSVDGQLSGDFATANDLVRRKNPDGTPAGGMFDDNRRVRAQKFRGEKSEGFFAPLSYFEYTGYNLSKLKIGDEFDSLNDKPICNKYVTPATLRTQKGSGKKTRSNTKWFHKHFETEQFRHWVDKIPAGALIIITEKQHGTSQRIGHVPDDLQLPLWKRLLISTGLFKFEQTRKWVYLHGSRNVVLDGGLNDPYYSSQFRARAVSKLEGNLRRGEVVYLEIVGWVNDSTTIMPKHDVTKLKDKELLKRYGKEMVYTYGNIAGECSPVVYRIAMVNEDGYETELSWNQAQARCDELGIPHVMQVCQPFVYDGDVEKLRTLCESLCGGVSTWDDRHIREGICLRIEHPQMFTILKLKNFEFLSLESNQKDSDDVVDIEEAS